MMKKLMVLTAAGTGYVLGTRAGRERYDQIVRTAQNFARNPQVRDAAQQAQDTVREQAPAVKDKAASAAGAAKAKVSSTDQSNPQAGSTADSDIPSWSSDRPTPPTGV